MSCACVVDAGVYETRPEERVRCDDLVEPRVVEPVVEHRIVVVVKLTFNIVIVKYDIIFCMLYNGSVSDTHLNDA